MNADTGEAQHEHVDTIVATIMADYDFLFTPGLPTMVDQLATRLARVLHAAVNGELRTELPSVDHPELFQQ